MELFQQFQRHALPEGNSPPCTSQLKEKSENLSLYCTYRVPCDSDNSDYVLKNFGNADAVIFSAN
jgi:hypothetical protein